MRLLIIILSLFLASCGGEKKSSPVTEPREEPVVAVGASPNATAEIAARTESSPRPKMGSKKMARGPAGSIDGSSTKIPAPNYSKAVKSAPKTVTGPVEQQLLTIASMVFNIKNKANIDEDIKVQLLINTTKPVEELRKELSVGGKTTEARIRVSKIIVASLAAPDFAITKITPEEQALSENHTTEWLWKLSPKSVGVHEVEVTVTAVIKVDGSTTSHHIRTYDQIVRIEITPGQVIDRWVEDNWQWAFTTLIIPFGIWAYRRRRVKKVKSAS